MDIKLYKNNVSPIEEVCVDDLKEGDLFVTSDGSRFKTKRNGVYEMDKASELVEGETVENLTPLQLRTYWRLMDYYTKNKSKNQEE